MANTPYENFVLENKLDSLLTTAVDFNNYITLDTSLTQAPGMIKTVNRYTASGAVEELAEGDGNTSGVSVSFEGVDYEVGVTQGMFEYTDEQEMKDPFIVDAGLRAMAELMVNDLTAKAIAEYDSATLTSTWASGGAFDFDAAVDAIAELNTEDETGLTFFICPTDKAAIRKAMNDDLKYVEAFARTGYIGSVAGVPVVVSKAITSGNVYLAARDAVTAFVKKGSEVEQERDANTRTNTVYARKVAVVALTDANKVVKITEAGA